MRVPDDGIVHHAGQFVQLPLLVVPRYSFSCKVASYYQRNADSFVYFPYVYNYDFLQFTANSIIALSLLYL